MMVSKIASAIYNDLVGGLAGIEATVNISLKLLEDEVVEERLAVIKQYSLKNLIPVKDLAYSLNCIELDCKSLDKCCNAGPCDKVSQHFEIPLIVNDFGENAVLYIGSTDKLIPFKVYTNTNFKYHKYKTRRKNKPYVYIDTTPNENNMYDGYVFNAPMLERLTVIAVFKDPRQVELYACCGFEEADNFSWIATEIKSNILRKKLNYYRLLYPQPNLNDQVPR